MTSNFSSILLLMAGVIVCAGGAMVMFRTEPMERTWRAASAFALLGAGALMLMAFERYGATGVPWEFPISALLFCVPVMRAIVPRQRRVACLGLTDDPTSRVHRIPPGGIWVVLALVVLAPVLAL